MAVTGVPNNANPAKVINLSFGGDQPCSSSYQTVIDELAAVGTLVVVAAGNSQGLGDNMQLKRPADCRGVMAVGAVQANGLKTSYSYVGSNMSLMAPGGHSSSSGNPGNTATLLLSTSNSGTQAPAAHEEGYKQGTSFSAPLAAGVASLMMAINPLLSPDALILRMKASARSFTGSATSCIVNPSVACTCNTSVCGAGMLNPLAAVQASYAPAAVIAPVGKPLPGAVITLDARSSAAVGTPTISSYVWAIQQGSGLTIASPTAALTQVRLPETPGVFVFQLSVTDTLGQTGLAQLRIDTMPLPEPASTASTSSSGGGGGADSRAWLALLLVLTVIATVSAARQARRTHIRLQPKQDKSKS
ncbi:MAG: S8 family serine peptidase [Brachymonas sp.]